MTTRAVCLDVMGTLFDLSAPRRRLEDLGAPPAALEAWFGRLLHTAATVTLIDDYRPFPELAKPVLESVLAQLDLDPDGAAHVLDALA
jgi:2-haloacid dehalogenase